MHNHTCAKCKKPVIASIPMESPYTIYCRDCWWSDNWDPSDYAQDFDFSRPFFDQFNELMIKVPKMAAFQLNNENCEFSHITAFCKSCYMCPGTFSSENCFYTRKSQYCNQCADNNTLNKCELVADSSYSDNCYSSHHLINCRNCSDSSYLSDCSNLQNCFMCSGLNSAKFNFKNKKVSEEEYKKIIDEYSGKSPEDLHEEFQEFNKTIPKRAQIQVNCFESTGDYLFDCNNAIKCSNCFKIEDSKYLFECEDVKDSMDLTMHDLGIELCYELCTAGDKSFMSAFSFCAAGSSHSYYLFSCFYTGNCFGCDALHNQQEYWILNKPYKKEEYMELAPKIISHLQETKEWGEFFPTSISPYEYNETLAQDYFPLGKEEVELKGWKWREKKDEIPKVEKIIPAEQLPESINDIPDDVLNWAIKCEETKRPFRIVKQELEFYRKMKLPIPHLHPDERHKRRMELRNPRKLWERKCDKCSDAIFTTYSPDRPEIVYCKK